ncbi:MAG: DUF4132 domain-containing protein [Saprospiraceae bacterium]|nr:DUF4132 domain-containing protein [Saprospiraceae bacterium]
MDFFDQLKKRITGKSGSRSNKGPLSDNFGDSLLTEHINLLLETIPAADQTSLLSFFQLCLEQENKNAPTGKWLPTAEKTLASLPYSTQARYFTAILRLTIDYIQQKHRQLPDDFRGQRTAGVPNWISPICWYMGRFLSNESGVREALSDLADIGYKKMPVMGSLAIKTANACLQGFALMPENKGIISIIRQQKKAVNRVIKSSIDRILDGLAAKNGITQGELKELSIPDFNLDENLMAVHDFQEYEAILSIENRSVVQLQWLQKSSGKALKSTPAAVKKDPAFKSLQLLQKELKDALGSTAQSLEAAWLERRTWTQKSLSERLLKHPVLQSIASRLIWQFEQGERLAAAIWQGGRWQNPDGDTLEWIQPDTIVRLWHPINSTARQVLAWRDWLEQQRITQPIKQAFREIYIVTPPEMATNSYSNRFAAHIIRQHQFAALCAQRGWKYRLQGQFDSANTAYRSVPAWNYSIEFWVDANDLNQVSDMGICQYVFTDQVRFYRQQTQVNMHEVPPLLFSELMRDVDLFVGVCSIGNDPNWQDAGDARMRDYWQHYAFAEELSSAGEVRMDALKRIVPRLNIGPKCRFEGKYLFVQGTKHTYKIHCGSGNILMSPNDQYLCIVPDRTELAKHPVYLPFEGDHMLSVIISKAILLADDTRIKDTTILRQL